MTYSSSTIPRIGGRSPEIPDAITVPIARHHMAIADALRALAIVLVVLNHLFLFSHPIVGHRALRLGYLGVWGVNTFFLLSGFLLGKDYIRAILDARGFPDTKRFLARRFLRIYPLYAVAIAVSAVLVASFLRPVSAVAVLEHAFMLQGTIESAVFALNAPLWTMGIDAAFYLALPIFMGVIYVSTRTLSKRMKVRGLCGALVGVVIASFVYRYYESSHTVAVMGSFTALVVNVRTVLGMATAFALGIGIALAVQIVPRGRFNPQFYAALVGLGAVIGGAELLGRFEETSVRNWAGYLKLACLDPIAAVSAALILYGLLQGGIPAISRCARVPIMAPIAGLAYAVYLFHYPLLEVFDTRVLHGAAGPKSLVELALCAIVIVLPVAALAHRVVERPFLELKDRLRARLP